MEAVIVNLPLPSLIIKYIALICLMMSLRLQVTEGRGGIGISSCQTVCACKWKGGKQTVECIDRSLGSIPESIDPNTQVLDMSDNNLRTLPRDTFIKSGLVNLQKVYLRNCRLGHIDDYAFKGLTNLVELDLSHNILTGIPSATFTYVASLRELTMSRNPVQKIDSHAFHATHSLTKLDLSHCDIHIVAPEAFNGLNALHSLKLNGNQLSELRPRTIETLSTLHGVELHDNPWLCDCRLRAAKIWLTENNIPYPVAPICSGGPERVIDRTFAELNIDDFACRPEIMPVNRFIEANTGDNATINCRTSAIPSANINWYWNGHLLLNGSTFSAYQKVYVFEAGEFEKRSRLVLTNTQVADSGEFYCVADNQAGSAETNFTLRVTMCAVGMSTFGREHIAGLTALLAIIILSILFVTIFLLARLKRLPFSGCKTAAHLEVLTITASPQPVTNGKQCSIVTSYDSTDCNRSDFKFTNPVQKPPRSTEISYSTSHCVCNGSILSSTAGTTNPFVSPSGSAGKNPDLISDTEPRSDHNNDEQLLTICMELDAINRPGSGEYSRAAGCDSLYPSGLWAMNEQQIIAKKISSQNQQTQLANAAQEYILKRATSATLAPYGCKSTKIDDSINAVSRASLDNKDNNDGVPSVVEQFISRTFPRTLTTQQQHLIRERQYLSAKCSGYPSDYGLPLVPGAEHIKTIDILPPSRLASNAKVLRVWQRGGVPVLPPVTALKRALTSSRNSPDEGYQEGCGTDV